MTFIPSGLSLRLVAVGGYCSPVPSARTYALGETPTVVSLGRGGFRPVCHRSVLVEVVGAYSRPAKAGEIKPRQGRRLVFEAVSCLLPQRTKRQGRHYDVALVASVLAGVSESDGALL